MTLKRKQLPGVIVPTGATPLSVRYLKGVETYLGLDKPLATKDITLKDYFPGATNQYYCGVRHVMISGDTLEFYVITGLGRTTIAIVNFFDYNYSQYKLMLNSVAPAFQTTVITHLPVVADIITKLFLNPLFPQLKIEAITSPAPRMKLVKGDHWVVLPIIQPRNPAQYVMFSKLNIVDNPESIPRLGRLITPTTPRWNTRVIERKQTDENPVMHISKLATVRPKTVSPSVEKEFDPDYEITLTEM